MDKMLESTAALQTHCKSGSKVGRLAKTGLMVVITALLCTIILGGVFGVKEAQAAVASVGTSTPAFVSGTTNTALTLTLTPPSGNIGDLLIAHVNYRNGTTATMTGTVATGWTLLSNITTTTAADGQVIYYKVATTATEASNFTWAYTNATNTPRIGGAISRYSGVDISAAPVFTTALGTATASAVTAPTVTTTVANSVVVTFMGQYSITAIVNPASMTSAYANAAAASGPTISSAYVAQAAAGASGAKTSTTSLANWVAHSVVLKPDSTPPTVSSITPSTTATNAASVNYTVTFSESVTGVAVGNFSVATTGSVSGASIGTISGSGSVWTVPVNTGSGDGTVQLNLSSTTPSILDSASNALTATFTGTSVTVDKTAPSNQNTVFAASAVKKGGAAVTIISSGDTTNGVWFAPTGTSTFTAGATMTKATNGLSTSILTPATAGVYYLYVVDAAGNVSSSSIATLTVDNTAPTNQNTVFAAAATKKGGAAVTIVSSGDATNSVWFAPSGTTTFTAGATMTTVAGDATSILAPATAGSYKLFVLDAAANYSTASTATLTVENTAPTAAITYSATSPYKAGTAVTITATFSEAMADAPAPMISISGTNTLTATAMTKTSTTVYTYSYTVGSGNGSATVALSAGTDVAGNSITSAPTSGATFTVDNTAPSVSSTTPSNAATAITPNTSFTITWNEAISCNTVDASTVTIAGGTAGEWVKSSCPTSSSATFTTNNQDNNRQYTVTVGTGVTDAAGNSMAAPYSFSYTTAAAAASVTAKQYFLHGDTTTNLGFDGTATLPTAASQTGTAIPYKGTLTTLTGTANSWRPTSIPIGTNNMIDGYTGVYSSNLTVSSISSSCAIRSGATSDIWKFYLYDYNPADGARTLVATSANVTVTTAGTTFAGIPASWTINNSNIQKDHRLIFRIQKVSTAASTGDRVYYEAATATTGCWVNVTETVEVEVTPPATSIFSAPATSANRTIAPITFTASDNVGVTGYMITTSGTAPAASALGWTDSAPASYTVAADGNYTLYPWVRDAVGNVSAAYAGVGVTVDTTAPVVAITAPAAGASVNGSSKISFTDTEITAPLCSINNSNWTSCVSDTTTFADLTGFTGRGEGNFTLYLKDADSLGNTSSTATVSLVKDSVVGFQNAIPAAGSIRDDDNISYELTETIASGSITFTRTGGTADASSPQTYYMLAKDMTAGLHAVHPGLNLVNGTVYSVSFQGTDSIGNNAPVVHTNVTYNSAAQKVYIVSPVAGSVVKDAVVSYRLNEAMTGGTITFESPDDPGVHTLTLLNNDQLSTGDHTVSTGFALINEVTYTLTLSFGDYAAHTNQAVSDSVRFDWSSARPYNITPASGSRFNSTRVSYTLPVMKGWNGTEFVSADAPSGQIIFTRTDTLAAQSYDLTSSPGSLSSGIHTVDTGVSLVDGVTYSVTVIIDDVDGDSFTVTDAKVTYDITAPANQNDVLAAPDTRVGGSILSIASSGDATNSVWLAPSGTTTFSAGTTMTTAGGTATAINTPSAEGTYYLFVIDAAGNRSNPSTAAITVLNTPQTITVTNAAPASAVYNSSFDVSATASSGLSVTIAASGGCSGNGSNTATVTMTSGTTACTVSYTQAGNNSYIAAPEVTSSTTATKAASVVTTWPTASGIAYGQSLAASTLSGGMATPAGTFVFTIPATTPNVGTASHSVSFMPTETANYGSPTGSANVTVTEALMSVTPSSYLFGVETLSDCANSRAIPFTVTNSSSYSRELGTITLSEVDADQYAISSDSCSGQTLAKQSSCTLNLKFCPTSTGSKSAVLDIRLAHAGSPAITALLHNHESNTEEARRRVPAVINSLTIPDTMAAGQTYTLTWSLLGYDASYLSMISFFDCTGINDGSCGDSYGKNFRASAYLQPTGVQDNGSWSYSGVNSKILSYSYSFTVPAIAANKDIVIRFFGKSQADADSGIAGLSAMIPGGLSQTYYDLVGRRILKHLSVN